MMTKTEMTEVFKGGRGCKISLPLTTLRAQAFSILEDFQRKFEEICKTEKTLSILDREWDTAHDTAWAYCRLDILTIEEASNYDKRLTATLKEALENE